MTSQSYILTLFKPDLDGYRWEKIHEAIWEDGKAIYLGSQLEKCPQSGRLHWQAFIKFASQTKQRGTYFKKFDNAIHWEKCSRERSAAINYGTKEETRVEGPKEDGTKPAPVAKGADWVAIKDAIVSDNKEGVDFAMVIRYNLERRWNALRMFYTKEIRMDLPAFLPNPWGLLFPVVYNIKKRHYWIWSDQPNRGKTHLFAKPLAKNYKVRLITGDTTYYNVETSDQCVIFDEYNTHKFHYSTFNSMCDGTFAYRKCGQASIVLHDPLIIILSNQSIVSLYPVRNDLLTARFTEYQLT